ncbi:hypothetical protein DPX16_4556 [Anabarilius grahami]|uniref:Uncharacterized protein n=1 Tax=Anabarilius grahami TaxID=495550 RepID=A0A3N0YBY2_ANAGA|nr:hypothetical protein DPX16_4556 [Anabarilius grahami]
MDSSRLLEVCCGICTKMLAADPLSPAWKLEWRASKAKVDGKTYMLPSGPQLPALEAHTSLFSETWCPAKSLISVSALWLLWTSAKLQTLTSLLPLSLSLVLFFRFCFGLLLSLIPHPLLISAAKHSAVAMAAGRLELWSDAANESPEIPAAAHLPENNNSSGGGEIKPIKYAGSIRLNHSSLRLDIKGVCCGVRKKKPKMTSRSRWALELTGENGFIGVLYRSRGFLTQF